MPIALLGFGVLLLLVGGIVLLLNIKNVKRRSRILNTPTTAIAQAPGNGVVEVKGRVVPSEEGVVQGPFSGRQGVFVRVLVQELRSTGRSSYWATIVNEVDQRCFFVDDGSGEVARVVPAAANVMLERQLIAQSGTFNDAQPHLQAFLQSRGKNSTGLLGFNKALRYYEEILYPGQPIYALGPSRRIAGPPVNDGYRMVPSTQLLLEAIPRNPIGELILSTRSEEQLVSNLLWGFVTGAVMSGIGVLLSIGGLIALVVGAD